MPVLWYQIKVDSDLVVLLSLLPSNTFSVTITRETVTFAPRFFCVNILGTVFTCHCVLETS